MKHLKHLLFALPMLLVAMSFAGCNTEEVDPVIPELEIAESLTGEAVESLTLQFDATESSQTFAVRCNRAWTAVSSSADWAVVTPEEGEGDNTVTVTVSRNAGTSRKAEIVVSTILFKRSITIEQTGEQADAKVIFFDNLDGEAASQDSNNKWPYANEFQKYNKKGTGAAEVTYDSKSVTVRSNSPSNDTKYNTSDYSVNEASGVNNLYFAAGGEFIVKKIALDGEQKLHMEWGVERNEYGNYDAPFNPTEFIVSLSADGVKWSTLTYTRSDYSAWDKAMADFQLKEAAQYLYIKMAASIATRVDDIKLTTGAGGQEIDLAAGEDSGDNEGDDPQDPTVDGTKLYYESFDGYALSANTKLDAFETGGGFVRQGLGGAGASYTGTTFDFRKSHASEKYTGASGGNNAFGNKADVVFIVNNINVGNAQNIDLSMGLRVYTAYNPAEFEAYYTTDGGATYKQLTLTRDAADGWKLTTASFTVAENESIVGLKFVSKVADQQFRIDDLTLSTKDENVKIESVPVVKTADATDITKSGATLGGSYEFDGTISEVGVAYKVAGATDYTVEKALAIQSPFAVTLNTLTDGTNYEYYAYVMVDGKEYKGEVKNFATEKDLTTAVTYFADDFASVENNKVYTSGKWTFTSTDAGWPANVYLGWFGKTYDKDGSKYINVAPYSSSMSEVVAYAVMTKFNVADAEGKKLTFDLAWYFKDAKDNSKFEVVASKDYAGDVATATWEVVESYTYTDESINPINTWTSYSLDLSTKYAAEKALTVAFRYTGKSNTYRLDNVEFGAAEAVVEVLTVTTGEATDVTATTATVAGSYSGVTEAPAEVGVEYRLSGVADYTKVAAAAVAETFTVALSELVEESSYDYRAYAVQGEQTTYGEVKTFTTAAPEQEEEEYTPIANVELDGTYTVKGVVTALSSRGFILTDDSGSIFYYGSKSYAIGQTLTVTGKISQYNKGLQIDGTSTTIVEGEVVTYEYPTPATADAAAIDAFISNTANRLATYVTLTGDLDISGSYYNVAVEGTTNMGSIYYPSNDIKAALTTGTNITIKGYAIAVSGGKYYNVVASEVTTNYVIPKVTPAATTLSFVAEGESKSVELTVAGQGENQLFAKSNNEHFVATIEGTTLTVTAAANESTEAKTATVTVYMAATADAEAVASAEITCSQAAPSTGDETEQVVYTTGFEVNNRDTSASNSYTADAKTYMADGKVWTFVYADLVTTGKPLVGSFNAMARIAKNTTNTPTVTTAVISETNKVTKVVFKSTAPATISMKVQYSTDNGATWVDSDFNKALTTTSTEYTANINASGSVMIRFAPYVTNATSTSSNRDIKIDDVIVYGMK